MSKHVRQHNNLNFKLSTDPVDTLSTDNEDSSSIGSQRCYFGADIVELSGNPAMLVLYAQGCTGWDRGRVMLCQMVGESLTLTG